MATREQLIEDFADHKYATGEKFARLINSMKVVQEPVADPAASGTSLSFIDSIEQDKDGKITATKKTLDLSNAHELNPFKGWWKTGDTLPTSGFDGAYLYFKDTTQTPAVTTIYRWNGTAYADTGTEVDESNVQTFGSGQAVNAMKITPNIVPNNDTKKIADARQINNLLDFISVEGKNLLYGTWITGKYYKADGSIGGGGAYKRMVIPCEPNTTYYYSAGSSNIGSTACHVVLFSNADGTGFESDAGHCERQGLLITTGANTKSIGVSAFTSASELQLELGTSRTEYEEPFEPYNTFSIKESVLPAMVIPDGSITIEKLAEGIVTNELVLDTETGKIADARQINNLVDNALNVSKNLLYLAEWDNGHYFKSDGTKAGGAAFKCTLVPCESNTDYYLSVGSGNIGGSPSVYVVLFGEGGLNDFISPAVGHISTPSLLIHTTNDSKYIGVSVGTSSDSPQLELGTSRTTYEEPFEPYISTKIKESLLPPVNIPDGSITAEKLEEGISLPASPNMFGRIYANNNTLAGNTLLVTDFVECYKNISIVAHIRSEFTEIQVGLSYHGFYGGSFKIDGTNIILVSGENDTVRATLPHGLTLGSETTFIIDKGVGATAKITLINDQGDMYQHDISSFGSCQGRPFLRNNGSSSIDAELSFYPKDINKKIWMFGDSYFSYSGDNRWTYYLISNGYTSNLMISRGGDSATDALNSLNTLLSTGSRPSYILWFMGMNGGNDAVDGPNAAWLEKTQAMLTLCSEYSITPVLATIPSVPRSGGKLHIYMNQWIKNSGYRYIDCAAAVEEENTLYWKNWGTSKAMLSSDEEHPTSYGAKALYSRVIVDFPEITIED